jgi:hypothetical protein
MEHCLSLGPLAHPLEVGGRAGERLSRKLRLSMTMAIQGDQFCIGFYNGFYDHYGQTRYLVVDTNGQSFRHNGFRRVRHVGAKRGKWMVDNIKLIEQLRDRFSVWHWWKASWKELKSYGAP